MKDSAAKDNLVEAGEPPIEKEAFVPATGIISVRRSMSIPPLSNTKFWGWIASGCALIGVFLLFWQGPMPFEVSMLRLARIDAFQALSLSSNLAMVRHYYALSLGIDLLLAGVIVLCGLIWTRLDETARSLTFSWTATAAASCALMIYLNRMESEGAWLPVSVLMRRPSALPIFGHRLLFVWVAKAFQLVAPSLTDKQGFYMSQYVAIVITVYALGRWSALHIGNTLSWVGQILGALLLSTCFSYFNFYDIGTVFFTTCGLIAIYTKRYWWLVPVFLVGTLNYEGLLLLIPVVVVMSYDQDRPKRWIPPVLVSLLTYCGVRLALQTALPLPRAVDWRIWSNVTDPFLNGRELTYSLMALTGWYALALMSLGDCDAKLRRLVFLFPLIFVVTFLFGQFHEPRQFDAFIPVVVALILSASRRRFEFGTELGASDVRLKLGR